MIVLTLEELIAKEITRALFAKQSMDSNDMEREVIKQLKKFRNYGKKRRKI